jgi:hypothetical protein
MFIESSAPRVPGHHAILQSGLFSATSGVNCMSFWYNMYGTTIGTLNVWVQPQGNATATTLWSLSGQQGNTWRNGIIPIPTQTSSFIVGGTNKLTCVLENVELLMFFLSVKFNTFDTLLFNKVQHF